jgi:hypothetical protein
MTKTLYKSGQTPMKGDLVRCVDFKNSNGYTNHDLKNLTRNEVLAVSEGKSSTLIKVAAGGYTGTRFFTAERFSLIRRSTKFVPTEKSIPKTLIVSTAGSVARAVKDDENLDDILSDLLLENPKAQFLIYQYEKTAKTQRPIVEYINHSSTKHDNRALDKTVTELESLPGFAFAAAKRPKFSKT